MPVSRSVSVPVRSRVGVAAMDTLGRKVVVCDNGTGVSLCERRRDPPCCRGGGEGEAGRLPPEPARLPAGTARGPRPPGPAAATGPGRHPAARAGPRNEWAGGAGGPRPGIPVSPTRGGSALLALLCPPASPRRSRFTVDILISLRDLSRSRWSKRAFRRKYRFLNILNERIMHSAIRMCPVSVGLLV